MPKRPPMHGWKTWLAAGLSVAYGAGGLVAGVHDLEVGMGFILGGLGLVGLAHKVELAGQPPRPSAHPPPQRRASDPPAEGGP